MHFRQTCFTWGDCVDVMRGFPDECIDLTVTSPPYDDMRDYDGYSFDFEKIANQLFRITKSGGIVVWIVNDRFMEGSLSLTRLLTVHLLQRHRLQCERQNDL